MQFASNESVFLLNGLFKMKQNPFSYIKVNLSTVGLIISKTMSANKVCSGESLHVLTVSFFDFLLLLKKSKIPIVIEMLF